MRYETAGRETEERIYLNSVGYLGAVAQIPFRSLKRILDHSRVRFTANLMFAPGNQGNGLFRRDPSPVNFAHGQRCFIEIQETPPHIIETVEY
jgi:hypothetical protein